MTRITTVIRLSLVAVLLSVPVFAFALQGGDVVAEPYIEANLRATTDVNAELVATIYNGDQYPVIGRSEFFPWLLLGDPATEEPYGWVFQDLVLVNGNVNAIPYSDFVANAPPTPTLLPTSMPTSAAPSATPELVGVAVGALPTSTIAPSNETPNIATATPVMMSGVTGQVSGEINVRFGPGVDYPRVGVARAGETFEITAYHTAVPWVQIRYDAVTGGFGWVAIDLLEITGDIYSLPSTSRTDFALPTLTPTPNAVTAVNSLPGVESNDLSPEFRALGEELWGMVLEGGFEPETSRLGSLFLMDLQTGEAISFGDDIAYSGMSLSKIGILTTMYRQLDALPDGEQTRHLANMMICSENTSSNEILTYIGGTPYTGASEVTATLEGLGLTDTFMVAPFLIDPRITPQPVTAPQSPADQTRAAPDPYNQMTVTEFGALLNGIYQCAADGSGALIDAYGNQFTQNECQSMLYLMQNNKIGALLESSVPAGVDVAHKHGWIDDTHGDAGIVFSPGGDYIFVVVLHNPTWLNFEESFPLIEEMGRITYNYFNPDEPLNATRQSTVPETCDLFNAEGARIMDNLMRGRVE